jgi:putative lipoprotein (rSAM/lipoprotein system)
MKKRALRFYDKLVMLLMGMFSFITACDDNSSSPVICMYGTLSSHFIAKGTVTDSLTNMPVQNIQVTLSQAFLVDDRTYYNTDTAYTDASGKYAVALWGSRTAFDLNPVAMKVADIDGTDHDGLFLEETATIRITSTEWTENTDEDENEDNVTKTMDFKLNK